VRSVHIYRTIYQDLCDQIVAGVLKPGEKLASETELAVHYGVSRMTVRQAMDLLGADRAVVKRRGAGTFVAKHERTFRRQNRLHSFREETGRTEAEVTATVLVQEMARPPANVMERLGLRPRQAAVHLVRLRMLNGQPAAIQATWIPYGLAPQLVRLDMRCSSLYHVLDEQFGIHLQWAEQEITASAATEQQAEWLSVKPSTPLITTTRIAYQASGAVAEFTNGWTRPEYPLFIRLNA
jgi:GntR family transcriptional regulator